MTAVLSRLVPPRLRRHVAAAWSRRGPLPAKRYRSSDQGVGLTEVLSIAPPVIHVAHWMDPGGHFMFCMDELFAALRGRPAWFLYAWFWNIEDPAHVGLVRRFERHHVRGEPGHRFIHLCNSREQLAVFEAARLDAILCSHNAFVDERIFHPLPDAVREFDAIYDARLKGYKRHELAREVESLALVHAPDLEGDDPGEGRRVRAMLDHARFLNREDGGAYADMTPEGVNRALNRCRVGLCLSAEEGAMRASIQYLLAGLTVVSTPSRGGRDLYFDADTALIVEPTAAAVRAGVAEMIRRNIPPAVVRQKALAHINRDRSTFVDRVQRIYDESDARRSFADEFAAARYNTLLRFQRHADVAARLRS